MNQMLWLDTCARRLGELDKGLIPPEVDGIALRLWHSSRPSFRHCHPVTAAETWYFGNDAERSIATGPANLPARAPAKRL